MVGLDPSALYKTQFDFINHFAKTDIVYELLGVEHLPYYEEKFDLIFCLGVLYHRSDPVSMLKELFKGLAEEGEVILDTFYIEGDDDLARLNQRKQYHEEASSFCINVMKEINARTYQLRAFIEWERFIQGGRRPTLLLKKSAMSMLRLKLMLQSCKRCLSFSHSQLQDISSHLLSERSIGMARSAY